MPKVKRLFVEKRAGFDIAAKALCKDLRDSLGIRGLSKVRILARYDVQGLCEGAFAAARDTVFSEPAADICYDEDFAPEKGIIFAAELLPGQYDQRADAAAQCLQILTGGERPVVRVANIYILIGDISENDFEKIKKHMINPVEAREATLLKYENLIDKMPEPEGVKRLSGFTELDREGLLTLLSEMGLAMDYEDLSLCQKYFKDEEKRDPTVTEIKMLDTYWSDHCRHTTFHTALDVEIEEGAVKEAFLKYLDLRRALYGERERDITLMDAATIGAKSLKSEGYLKNLDESEEINACSIIVEADINGAPHEYLVMFKNETHNHPTEIEPFGGASTCLGGAIRDPLSGRTYVYQAMRITGSADPRAPISATLPGKLPQVKITQTAARGYSSYGNQIGVATGLVREVYHEGYMAKRMELGAVIAAAPRENVVRKAPAPGDLVILIGGKTGRDGCGGATGSSKAHTEDSLATCGAEVQKGNPVEGRKLQRLFRNKAASALIKRCNDFGAGGVSVAIGELADGVRINLDAVPKKYEGLDGTELAISESQERMAVVVAPGDADKLIALADGENLEATVVAEVTKTPRLKMYWRGDKIVDISREFLNTNGAPKKAAAYIPNPSAKGLFKVGAPEGGSMAEKWLACLSSLNVCGQKGLAEMFDSTVGAQNMLMPYGGRRQLTPAESMVARLPVLNGETKIGTVMAHGLNPHLAAKSPFHGGVFAVVEAVTKAVAAGADYKKCYLTMQEYFERLGSDKNRWGKPLAALLGALAAQRELCIGAIGGKDSMSGSFEEIDVPPTLATFAVADMDTSKAVSPEFKREGSRVYIVEAEYDGENLPVFKKLRESYEFIQKLATGGGISAAHTVGLGGIAAAVSKMCFGNGLGFSFASEEESLFECRYGGIILETEGELPAPARLLGRTTDKNMIETPDGNISLDDALAAWSEPLSEVFPPAGRRQEKGAPAAADSGAKRVVFAKKSFARPRVFIPIFPGTNCEYDSAAAFARAGAEVSAEIFRNLSPKAVSESIEAIVKGIENAQIVMLPGGFSGGDDPDGSGKFIAAVFRNPKVAAATESLLNERDGLMLGICNGFQALIKLGLVPFGAITPPGPDSPTLTFNAAGHHVSQMVRVRTCSVKSPWLSKSSVGDVDTMPISHGEGRFVISEGAYLSLLENGQIATQYVDNDGNPTYDARFNPNGSNCAVEGITSPDGRVFGRMGHSERVRPGLYKNICAVSDERIFEAGVSYYK